MLCVGAAVGAGLYTFRYAEGTSYLSNDPAACLNCHVMQEAYNTWRHSVHGRVAVCNDCHTPADPLGKWWTKAENGFHHSKAFTLGDFQEPIRARAGNRAIAQANCIRCHGAILEDPAPETPHGALADDCIRCHQHVAHPRGRSPSPS